MALRNQLQAIDTEITNTTNNAAGNRSAAIEKLKADRGYQQQQQTVNDLKKSALNTQKMLSALPGDVKRRVAGRLVTASQQNRLLAHEQQPLATQYGDVARSLDVEQGGLRDIDTAADKLGQEMRMDTQMRLQALEGQRGSLFQQMQLEEQRAARAAAQNEARRQQQMQVDALNRAQQMEQNRLTGQGLKTAFGVDENGNPIGPKKISGMTTDLPNPGALTYLAGGTAGGLAGGLDLLTGVDPRQANSKLFSNADTYATPDELAYLKGGYKAGGDQALQNATQYLAVNGVNTSGMSAPQIRQKARQLGLPY